MTLRTTPFQTHFNYDVTVLIGHFRVPFYLCIKTCLGATPFI